MITPELIARINALSQKQRSSGLNEEEKQEQALLRQQYIAAIKDQVRQQVEPPPASPTPSRPCSCGCHGKHPHH